MSNPDKYITERELDCILDKNGAVQGRPGCDGRDGKDGQEGPRGERGAQGPEGKQGCQGERGPEGRRGERGLDGKDGCDGKDGRDGRDGEDGREGPIGPQGQKGQDGKDGRDGCCGDEGTPGLEGPQGEKGDKGDQGEQGIQGPMGVKGDTGEQGIQGVAGPKGDTGEKGDKGDPGDTGPTGPAGTNGVDGTDGSPGTPGTPGQDGADGTIVSVTQAGDSTTLIIDGTPYIITGEGTGGTGTVVTCVSGTDATGDYQELFFDGQPANPACRIYQGTEGPQGIQGIQGIQGFQGIQGEPGPQGIQGEPGTPGTPGQDGADGVSPTITCNQPTETTLALTIVDVNGTQTKTLDVGAGGSTGLDAAAVQTLIDASNCCITGITGPDANGTYTVAQTNGNSYTFTVSQQTGGLTQAQVQALIDASTCCITGVTGPDANGTYTIQQTNGANYTFTVAPSTGGGLTQTQVQALIDQTIANMSVQCVQTATGFNVQVVSNGAVVIESSQACTWPSTGSGNVTCVTAADPANPCLERTTLTVDGTPCYLVPYGNPECCACRCVTVTDGTIVNVVGTSQDGFSVDWGENNQVTQVAGGVGGTASYQFNTAGTYTISICLNSYCDTLSDWNITGPTSMEMKPCDGCN